MSKGQYGRKPTPTGKSNLPGIGHWSQELLTGDEAEEEGEDELASIEPETE